MPKDQKPDQTVKPIPEWDDFHRAQAVYDGALAGTVIPKRERKPKQR